MKTLIKDRYLPVLQVSVRDEHTGVMCSELLVLKDTHTGEVIIPETTPKQLKAYVKSLYPKSN